VNEDLSVGAQSSADHLLHSLGFADEDVTSEAAAACNDRRLDRMGRAARLDRGMIPAHHFPRLTAQNHRVTNPPSTACNCIAWAVGDTQSKWKPGLHWPLPTDPRIDTVGELQKTARGILWLVANVHAQ
jgi:hypothetical protein